MKYQLITSPSSSDLMEVKNWLIAEYKELGEGFYSNWSTIESAFLNNELICFRHNDMPVGFLVWTDNKLWAEIDIFEIKDDKRGNGLGRLFFSQVADFLKLKGFLVLKLFCSPSKSETFWRKLNFVKFPSIEFNESDLTYFKTLVDTQEVTNYPGSNNKIELWDVKPHQTRSHEAKWTWEIKYESNSNKLLRPIIYPCDRHWNLRWTKNGKEKYNNKVKHFRVSQTPILFGSFIIIQELI